MNQATEEMEADLEMVERSELGLKIEERLRTIFEPMEIWYFRSSIEKVSACHTFFSSPRSNRMNSTKGSPNG